MRGLGVFSSFDQLSLPRGEKLELQGVVARDLTERVNPSRRESNALTQAGVIIEHVNCDLATDASRHLLSNIFAAVRGRS